MLRITVYGHPAPQGSKRFVGVKRGRGIMIESSRHVMPWRQDVKAAALSAYEGAPLDGPLRVKMVFTLPKPKASKARYPHKRPDLSKLVRSTEDALVDAGVIADDARIVEYVRVAKVYPAEDPDALAIPGALIEILQVLE
jgi:crossover junction endodeoxyribonuclease RusA